MSRTIDERVVEMRFDNKNFESNVKTTMSTLERLKQALNFKNSGKSLENLSSAASKVNLSPIGSAVDTIQAKFSAMSVVGVTALANITNAAINTGTRMVKALTLDPILTGFQEYETQIGAVQTILANTQSKGTTLDDVNAALDELNHYADMTIYNFTEMTRNIGTFTAAGVDLEKSVTSIKGIANLAAVSGSTSVQASTAMYQLSQALAAGRVSLMDWNSVVNAGMGGELFQNALKRTAEHMGTNVDALIEKYGSFRESLTMGQWLTADVLTETLTQLSGAYTEADLIAQGYTEQQAKEITELAKTAVDAATKVKTFTQLWDTLREAAQSGWTETWETLVGDFGEAKMFFTDLSDYFGGVIGASADSRNQFLNEVLTSNYDKVAQLLEGRGISKGVFENKLTESLKANGVQVDELVEKYGSLSLAFQNGAIPASEFQKVVESMAGDVGDLSKVTGELKYGEGFDAYNEQVAEVQKTLKALGYDLGDFGEQADGVDGRLGDVTTAAIKAFQAANDLQQTGIIDDATLAKLQEANSELETTTGKINGLASEVGKLGGRQLLIDSLWNIINAFAAIGDVIGKAWNNIFPPATAEQIYGMIENFKEFTSSLIIGEETADKLQKVFEGVFSIFDIIGQAISAVWQGIKPLFGDLGDLGGSFLDVAADAGEWLVSLSDSIEQTGFFTTVVENLSTILSNAIQWIKDFFGAFGVNFKIPSFEEMLNSITTFFDKIKGSDAYQTISAVFESIKEVFASFFNSIPELIRSGDYKSIGKGIGEAFENVGKIFKGFDFSFITDWIDNLKEKGSQILEGLGEFGSGIVEGFKGIGEKLKNFNWSSLIPLVLLAGLVYSLVRIIKAVADTVSLFSGAFEGIEDVLGGFSKSLKAAAFAQMATSIAILAGAVAVLAMMDPARVWSSVGAIAALAAVITGMQILISKFGDAGKASDMAKLGTTVLAFGVAMLLLANVAKTIAKMSWGDMGKAAVGMAGLTVIITALVAITKLAGDNIDEAGSTLLKISAAMLILVAVAKIISGMTWGDMGKAAVGLAGLTIVIKALIKATQKAGKDIDKVGPTLLKLSAAMLILAIVLRLIAGMSWGDMGKAAVGITGLVLIINSLIKATGKAGRVKGLGGAFVGIAVAFLALAAVARIISGMSWEDMGKAAVGIGYLSIIISGLIAATKLAGKDLAKVGTTLIAISVAIGILAAVSALLGLIDTKSLIKGITAVGFLSIFISGMMAVTKVSKDVRGNFTAIAIAVGVLAAAVAALSFIEPSKLVTSVSAIALLMGVFTLVAHYSNGVKLSIKTMAVMIVVVGLLSGLIYLLSSLDVGSSIGTVASISLLLASMVASLKLISTVKTVSKGALVGLAAVSAALVVVAVILGVLDKLDVEASIPQAVALSTLLVALAGVTKILSTMGKGSATAAMKGAAAFDAVVVIIGALLGIVGWINEATNDGLLESVLSGAEVLAAVGEAIGGFVGSIVDGFINAATQNFGEVGANISDFAMNIIPFIAVAKTIDESVVLGIGYLSAAIIALAAADFISSIEDFLTFGSDYSDLADKLSSFILGVLPSLMLLSMVPESSITGAGYLADAVLSLSEAGLIDALTKLFGGESGTDSFSSGLTSLGEGLKSFVMATAGLTFNENVENAVDVAEAMTDVADAIPNDDGIWQGIIGFKNYTEFSAGIAQLGQGLKSFVSATKDLTFNENTQTAIDTAKAMTEVAKAIPNDNGLWQAISGFKDYTDFSAGMGKLGQGLKSFVSATKDLTFNENTQTAIDTAKAMTEVAKAIPNDDGLWQAISGFNDYTDFSAGMGQLGQGLKSFVSATKDLTFSETTQTAIDTAKAMTEVAKAIPNDDGLWQAISGFKDYTDFSAGVGQLGQGLKSFSSATSDLTFNENTDAAINAAKAVAGVAEALPETGGAWSLLAGDEDLGKFALNIALLGQGLKSFASATSGFSEVDTGAPVAVASALADISNTLDPDNFLDWLNGDNELSDFGGQLEALGGGLKKFSDAVIGMDPSGVETATNVAQTLANITTYVDNGLFNGKLSDFGADIAKFGTNIKTYSENLDGIDQSQMLTVSSAIDILTEALERMIGIDTSGVENFMSSLEKLSGADVQAFVEAFDGVDESLSTSFSSMVEGIISLGDSNVPSFNEIGGKLAQAISDGFSEDSGLLETEAGFALDDAISEIDGRVGDFNSSGEELVFAVAAGFGSGSGAASIAGTISSLMANCVAALNGYYGSFFSAGSYVVSGFAAGISANTYRASAQARAMANAAYSAAQAALQVHSPSRLFASLGRWVPEGMAVGISKYSNVVADSSEQMAQKAIDGTKSVIARIGGMIDGDIDATPVISPVMDLSNIQNGVNSITDMLNLSRDVGAISASFNSRSKYDQNYEVVSALNGLRKDIGSMSRPSYNINGITYDDGSNVSMAVESLIRAARIERRV